MIKRRIISIISVALLLLMFFRDTPTEILANSKRNAESDNLIFCTSNTLGVMTFTTIEVYLSTKEDYYLCDGKAKYYYRSIYSYGKTHVTDAGKISKYLVVPIKHYNSSNKLIQSFDWEEEDNIFPKADYICGVKNNSIIYYNKNTSCYAKCIVSVSVSGAMVPVKSVVSSYSLFVGAK